LNPVLENEEVKRAWGNGDGWRSYDLSWSGVVCVAFLFRFEKKMLILCFVSCFPSISEHSQWYTKVCRVRSYRQSCYVLISSRWVGALPAQYPMPWLCIRVAVLRHRVALFAEIPGAPISTMLIACRVNVIVVMQFMMGQLNSNTAISCSLNNVPRGSNVSRMGVQHVMFGGSRCILGYPKP
jgi:hypothetical protein